MSQWTHMAGLIVLDMPFPMPDLRNLLGDGIPAGSEGPAWFRIHEGKGFLYEPIEYQSRQSRYTTAEIVGDLRDFGDHPGDLEKITGWLEKVLLGCKDKAVIRQAVLHVQVEFGADSFAYWNGEKILVLTVGDEKVLVE